jgi:hypothetical protein
MALQWIEDEFATLDLRDIRRERRAKTIVEQLSSMADSTPDACQGDAALEATYRFADNDAISPDAILDAHHKAAIKRSAQCKTVIFAQDTTVVDLTKPNRQVKGAGPLESNDKFGFFLHPIYAIDESGIPLGVVDQITWVREPIRNDLTRAEKAALRRQACYEEKESCRWLEMFQSGEQIARANPQTHYVHVADSESDIYELFLEIESQAENHDFILRGCQNRSLVPSQDGAKTIDEALALCEIRTQCEVNVSERTSLIAGETRPRRKSRSARAAQIGIRATTVTLHGPSRPGGRLPDVTLNVVEAIELDVPEGEEPIRWVLLTSLPIGSVIAIQKVASQYALRWGIELFFKTLKSGLGIEKLKYETLERYLTVSSLMLVAAWRVEQVKIASRVDGDASCEEYFDPSEWKPVYMVAKKTRQLPKQAPTMNDFMLLLAKMGGYLNKKGQGPPGSTTIWRGMRKLEAYRDAYLAFGDT